MNKIITLAVITLGLTCAQTAQAHNLYCLDKSPFATYIACKTGDVLTVVVNENATTTDNGNALLNKESKLKATLEQLFTPFVNPIKGLTKTAGTGDTPEVELNTKSQYVAQANNAANHSLQTRIQVRMIEEVRRGEFVIRGHKEVNINGKPKKIYVTGVIRQRDINPDNTIMSDKIADSMIEIEGDVANKDLKPGVVTRLFNAVF